MDKLREMGVWQGAQHSLGLSPVPDLGAEASHNTRPVIIEFNHPDQ